MDLQLYDEIHICFCNCWVTIILSIKSVSRNIYCLWIQAFHRNLNKKSIIHRDTFFHVASKIFKINQYLMSNLWIIENSTKVQDCHDSGKDAEWETYVLNILNMYECFQPDGDISRGNYSHVSFLVLNLSVQIARSLNVYDYKK